MIKDGIFKFNEIALTPNMYDTDIKSIDSFNKIELENATFYLAKEKERLENMLFWIRITVIDGIIKKFELRNADEKYKMNYSNMTNELLEAKYQTHNNFLSQYLGEPNEENIGGKMYSFGWGSIYSFLDIKTGDCGIIVEYIKNI